MQRMQAVYHCDYRGAEITGSQPQGLVLPFFCCYIQAKVKWKINIPTKQTYVNTFCPQGAYANLYSYVYMCKSTHLSYKLCKYTLTHTSTCWRLQPWFSSTVACEVSNWKRTGCFAALYGRFHISLYPSPLLNPIQPS